MIKQLRFYANPSKQELNTNSIDDFKNKDKNGITLPDTLKTLQIKTYPGVKIKFYQQLTADSRNMQEVVIDHTGIYTLDENLQIKSFSTDLSSLIKDLNFYFIVDMTF